MRSTKLIRFLSICKIFYYLERPKYDQTISIYLLLAFVTLCIIFFSLRHVSKQPNGRQYHHILSKNAPYLGSKDFSWTSNNYTKSYTKSFLLATITTGFGSALIWFQLQSNTLNSHTPTYSEINCLSDPNHEKNVYRISVLCYQTPFLP